MLSHCAGCAYYSTSCWWGRSWWICTVWWFNYIDKTLSYSCLIMWLWLFYYLLHKQATFTFCFRLELLSLMPMLLLCTIFSFLPSFLFLQLTTLISSFTFPDDIYVVLPFIFSALNLHHCNIVFNLLIGIITSRLSCLLSRCHDPLVWQATNLFSFPPFSIMSF